MIRVDFEKGIVESPAPLGWSEGGLKGVGVLGDPSCYLRCLARRLVLMITGQASGLVALLQNVGAPAFVKVGPYGSI